MSNLNFADFYKVPDLNFDISKLRKDLDIVFKKKKFDSNGVSNFGAISLNQIPNDEESIKGNNIRGVYWTKPDETGKEVTRDVKIDESKYTQIVSEFENTYFAEVYETLKKKFKLGRVRILLKQPRTTLSWHRDPVARAIAGRPRLLLINGMLDRLDLRSCPEVLDSLFDKAAPWTLVIVTARDDIKDRCDRTVEWT